MTPAPSKGHAAARRCLATTIAAFAIFGVVSIVYRLADRPDWLLPIIGLLVAIAVAVGFATIVLYLLMFAAWLTRRKSV